MQLKAIIKPQYTKDDIQYALRDIANGKFERKASLNQGILQSTLQQQIASRVSRLEAHEYKQRLSPVQEQRLTDQVLVQESFRQNLTHAQIRAFARLILAARHDAIPLSKRQMASFLRRNPILKTKKQFRIDFAYVNSATSNIIKAQFQKLEILAIKAIKAKNRQNIDKARIIEGQKENSLIVKSAKKRFIQKKQLRLRA